MPSGSVRSTDNGYPHGGLGLAVSPQRVNCGHDGEELEQCQPAGR